MFLVADCVPNKNWILMVPVNQELLKGTSPSHLGIIDSDWQFLKNYKVHTEGFPTIYNT